MNIVFDCHPGCTPGRLPQWADIDIKARFGKKGGQPFGVMVLVFLPHITHQNPRPAPFPFNELLNSSFDWDICHAYGPIQPFD